MGAAEDSVSISVDLLSDLKQGLVGILTDSFTTQLLELSQYDQSMIEQTFIEALIRRIKRLLQFIIAK